MRRLLTPFWNADEGRPRALVRIGAQLAVFGVFSLVIQLAFWPIQRIVGSGWMTHAALFLVTTVAVVVSAYLGCRFLDRRSLGDLGLRVDARWILDAGFGFTLGALLMLSISAAERAAGWATYGPATGDGSSPALLGTSLVVFISVAVVEELVFRGYQLVNLAEGFRGRWLGPSGSVLAATLFSSVVFGLAHAANPHASPITTMNITLAGLMLASGFLLTGELGLPIGLHLSWNFFQNVLDMPVSGQRQFGYAAVVERIEDGPDWITGGAFGPEAGVTGLVAMVVGTLVIVAYARALEGRVRVHGSLLTRR
ncbi:MAG: CPBP family intramembrane metalloprotease [Sandaracinaceae bacterium]|nr:CPBP family intramembrane metalloprotease [Sandaracinaceae bacterium]